jgi:hypothetical protein
MRRRLTWLLGGWLIGTASSVWLRRRVRRGVERYTPEHLRRDLADQGTAMVRNVRRIVGEVSDATRDGRAEVGRTRSALDAEGTDPSGRCAESQALRPRPGAGLIRDGSVFGILSTDP